MPLSFARLRTLFVKRPTFLKARPLFQARPAKATGERLYAACVTQARQPAFYLDYGVEDAIGARFELLCLHVSAAVLTLRAVPATDPRHDQAHETGQALFDAFLGALDNTLREQGVGDLAVPKKMKALGVVIYTRMKRWDDLWTNQASVDSQADYAARTVFAGADFNDIGPSDDETATIEVPPHILAFAAYIEAVHRSLTADSLMAGRADWAVIPVLDAPITPQNQALEA
jgi:cytochrome b pre-mRNA-processing protein 3